MLSILVLRLALARLHSLRILLSRVSLSLCLLHHLFPIQIRLHFLLLALLSTTLCLSSLRLGLGLCLLGLLLLLLLLFRLQLRSHRCGICRLYLGIFLRIHTWE